MAQRTTYVNLRFGKKWIKYRQILFQFYFSMHPNQRRNLQHILTMQMIESKFWGLDQFCTKCNVTQ